MPPTSAETTRTARCARECFSPGHDCPAAAMTQPPHHRAIVYAVTAAGLVAYALSVTSPAFYGDSAHYWELAGSFHVNGAFSLDGFSNPLRGYALPLFLYGVQRAAAALAVDPVALFRVVSALTGAALFALAVPALLARTVGVRTSIALLLAYCALCAAYWHGHLIYPLSDVPAALLLTAGCCALPTETDRPWGAWRATAAGLTLALAASVRPINEAALAGATLFVFVHQGPGLLRGTHRPAALRALAAFLVAAGVAMWPQSSINQRIFGTRNPFAHQPVGQPGPDLYLQQLAWGLSIQRYETNIGGGPFPVAVMFNDAAGRQLVGLPPGVDPLGSASNAPKTQPEYVRFALGHPLFTASLMVRHLFNALDLGYPTPYVMRLAPRSALFAATNFIVLSIAAAVALVRSRHVMWTGRAGYQLAIVLVYLLPSLLALPTKPENRYFLPLWLMASGLAILGRPRLAADTVPAPAPRTMVACGVIGLVIGFLLASATYSHILGAPSSYEIWCLACRP
jgi:hypothetical protein